ncbi:hypothetical protein AWI62_05630 [Salmonella enterica]|uniref:Uncharacterized protein n=2 Tax=Salmonella enterica TaxID=28901 RepID=A0A759MMX2_SALER|nr:hypothetical protein [Salmonella enterica]ECE6302407.1 hypothetical protein [Salmonella enterica subsp. salamae]ECG4754109.1 hypothetical protein [Salmonella enterica subsp. enterica serovar Richmond]EDH7455532.1 hypothetical protein [Salmonella enterica subsp. diarizonae]HCM1910648.1 hypothetical protein [Salmonella enterica subsp. diarizonae serovar 53:k:e,n,x,z15]
MDKYSSCIILFTNSSTSSTVITGVLIFVIGQIILKWFLEPLLSLKEQLGKTSALFLREQAIITNCSNKNDIVNQLKESASSLLAKKSAVTWYCLFSCFRLVPSAENIQNASQSMNLIAGLIQKNNNEGNVATDIYSEMEKIANYLKIIVKYG